jgi:hypothetical protein
MTKRLELATRAFGAEPDQPDVAGLAGWITGHRGQSADIVTVQLDRSLAPQLTAGIMKPCAGGLFYRKRVLDSLNGVIDGKATGELHLDSQATIEDAAGIVVQKKGSWCAIPAPHKLAITDCFYDDANEWSDAINGMYRALMRAMRDIGISGHVLIGDTAKDEELAGLGDQKVFFFLPDPDRENLAVLLERQRQVAVGKDQLNILFDLAGEYDLRKVFIIDPDRKAVELALTHLDPDQVAVGGYCRGSCDEYWNDLASSSVYQL